MKKYMLIALFIVGLTNYALGQIDSIIYGITTYNDGSGLMLSKIDPQTGMVINISGSNVPFPVTVESRLIDPIHKLYFLPVDSTLLCFSLLTGDLVSATHIYQYYQSSLQGYYFNCPDSTIYGLAHDTTNGDLRLARIDPTSGIVTTISSNPISGQQNVLLGTTIDPHNRVYYYVSIDNHLMGVDINSGNVISSPTIIITQGKFGPIVYNCYDSVIYGLSGNATVGRRLGTINPLTGIVTEISSNVVATYLISDLPTIDPFKGVYYFKNVDQKLVGVNIHTGEVITDPVIIPTPGTTFYNFVYNHSCMIDIPVGIENENQALNFVVMPNPASTYINIETSGAWQFLIMNLSGQHLITRHITEPRMLVDISTLPSGVYVVKVIGENGVKVGKIIKD